MSSAGHEPAGMLDPRLPSAPHYIYEGPVSRSDSGCTQVAEVLSHDHCKGRFVVRLGLADDALRLSLKSGNLSAAEPGAAMSGPEPQLATAGREQQAAEFRGEKLASLKQRAAAAGVAAEVVEEAEESDDPKESMVQLLLELLPIEI